MDPSPSTAGWALSRVGQGDPDVASAVATALLNIESNASFSGQAVAGGYEGFAPALSYAPVRDVQRVRPRV
jgi:hypothetical protein